MTGRDRVRSPGRAGQVNFPPKESVVQVEVPDKVKAARREVEQQCSAAAQGSQWTCSTELTDSKFTKVASDMRLANQLLASSFCPSDLRRSRSPPRQRYDTQHYYAFTRGDVVTGWNHSTELPNRWQQRQQLQQLSAAAFTATARHKAHLKRYQSPPQREEAFAAALRQHKQDAAAHATALLQRYGPEGAAAMQQILQMKRPDRKPVHIKASKDDIAAVRQLPVAGLPEP